MRRRFGGARPTVAHSRLFAFIRDLLSRFLAGEGYRVTTAMSAADARAKLQGLNFDLLILDVMMPGETGFDLARFIRTTSTVPIVMLTARHEAESRIEGLQIGADDYVAKPFEPRELLLRIGNILKRATPAPVAKVESVRRQRQRARGGCADQPAAAQDRARSRQSVVPAGGARRRLSSGRLVVNGIR